MTFENFSKLVFQHIDQYSVAGTQIPLEYNNQADDIQRVCTLTNIALRIIATQTAPIMACFEPNDLQFTGRKDLGNGFTKITLPADFWKMTGKGLPNFSADRDYERGMHYNYVSANEILVETRKLPGMLITYYRYPRPVCGVKGELLDATEEVADCASFYVAAQLARQEDAYLYQSLYNEFESMMERLRKPMETELMPVKDAYF